MGCLAEVVLELFTEGYLELMMLIVPEKSQSGKLRTFLKVIAAVIALVLFFLMMIGALLWASDDSEAKTIGQYMVLIPLAVSILQIVIGVVLRHRAKNKKKESEKTPWEDC